MEFSAQTAEVLRAVGHQLPTRDALVCAVVEQQQAIEKKTEVIAAQQQRIALLEEQLRLLRGQRFGRSSEKRDGQLSLFDDEVEPEAPPVLDKPVRPRRSGRQGFSKEIPREPVYLRLSEEEKAGALDTFFVKVKEEL